MVPYELRGDIGNLDPWGTPEDLGAETLEGTPQLFGRFDHGGLDTPFSAGVYEATRGKFKAPYPFSEHATVLEGERRQQQDVWTGRQLVHRKGGDHNLGHKVRFGSQELSA